MKDRLKNIAMGALIGAAAAMIAEAVYFMYIYNGEDGETVVTDFETVGDEPVKE